MQLTKDTTVLDILEAGGSIKLPSGYELQGDPSSGYIQMLLPAQLGDHRDDGLCHLSASGLENAYTFAAQFEDEAATFAAQFEAA